MKPRLLLTLLCTLWLVPVALRAQQPGSTVALGPNGDTRPVGAQSVWYYLPGTPGESALYPGWYQLTGGAPASGAGRPVAITTTDVTTSGTVPAGSRAPVFIFRSGSGFTGTVNGVAWSATTDTQYAPPVPPGCVAPAIPYTVTAGTLRISDTR